MSNAYGRLFSPGHAIWGQPASRRQPWQYTKRHRKFDTGVQNVDELPAGLRAKLDHAIDASKYILSLKDNWDGEGSCAVDEATWTRATEFVRNYAKSVWTSLGIEIPVPYISQGPAGGIDILWKRQGCKLLLTLPSDSTGPIAYYGKNDSGDVTEGSFQSTNLGNLGLILWLMKST